MNNRAKTDEQKREIVDRLYAVWVKNPDLRFGQLIWNGYGNIESNLFYVEDRELISSMEEHYK